MHKPELRQSLQAARLEHARKLSPTERKAWAAQVADSLLELSSVETACTRGSIIASYLSLPSEPPTAELNHRIASLGARVVLPSYRSDSGQHLEELRWSFADDPKTWLSPRELTQQLAIIVVPALAATPAGARIGKGKGYYDRFLSKLRRYPDGPLRIAVVRDCEVLPELPEEPHDERVDVVASTP